MYRILVAHGVNLDLLGQREPEIYGEHTLEQINTKLADQAQKLSSDLHLEFFQTNCEATYLEKLSQSPWDGAILNPGAWTHTSLALADRLAAIARPFIEVHLSNPAAREEIRRHSMISHLAQGVIQGFGDESYVLALIGIWRHTLRHKT